MDQKEFDQIKNNQVICSRPFFEICNMLGRNYTPCCWGNDLSEANPHNALPFDYFDGEEFRRLRKEMLLGEKTDFLKSVCQKCHMLEDESNSSPRLKSKITKDLLENFNSDGSLKKTNSRFLKLSINIYGNYCNLECYECKPQNSTSRNIAIKKLNSKWHNLPGIKPRKYLSSESENYVFTIDDDVKKINSEQFYKIVEHVIKYSHNISLIEIVGGEPMMMKSHFELLDALIIYGQSKHIKLSYTSNMTTMKLSYMKKYFDNFKSTCIQWSVDGLKEKNYWLRFPTNWETTVNNVLEVQNFFKRTGLGTIRATITPSLLSIPSLLETYKWLYIKNLIAPGDYIYNTVKNPKMLRTRNLPNELKQKIANSVKSISEFHYHDMMQERNEEEFSLAIKYCDALDKSRGTDWRSTFPEVAKYAN